ncbi:MAG: hypothetical protein ACFHHU_13700 [Porticoccaceae bacterium]
MPARRRAHRCRGWFHAFGYLGELLSTASHNSGCIGTIVHGAVRDVARMKAIGFNVYALRTCVYDSQNRQRVVDARYPGRNRRRGLQLRRSGIRR